MFTSKTWCVCLQLDWSPCSDASRRSCYCSDSSYIAHQMHQSQ